MPPPDTAVVPPKLAAFSRTRTERPAFAARIAAVSLDAPDPTTITSYCISLVSIGGLRRFHDCLHLFARPADLTGDIERIPIFAPPDNFVVIIHIKDANDARNHFPIIGKQTNPVYPFCEHRVSAGRNIQNLASAIGVDTVLALRLGTDRFHPLDRPR